jgi:hypothetical protein
LICRSFVGCGWRPSIQFSPNSKCFYQSVEEDFFSGSDETKFNVTKLVFWFCIESAVGGIFPGNPNFSPTSACGRALHSTDRSHDTAQIGYLRCRPVNSVPHGNRAIILANLLCLLRLVRTSEADPLLSSRDEDQGSETTIRGSAAYL